MISHTGCDHERTPGARAKCRRTRSKGETLPWPQPPLYSLGPPPKVREVKWGGKAHHDPDRERNQGTTPRDRDKQCDICGVEKILVRGTDPLRGILIFVGERCSYMVERSDDFQVLP